MDDSKYEHLSNLAKANESQASQTLVKARQYQQKMAEQLEKLKTYKAEYEAKLSSAGAGSIGAKQLQDYRLFLNKLDQAIGQQQNAINKSDKDVSQAESEFLDRRSHRSAVDKLLEVRQRDRRLEQDKREQRLVDEMSSTRARTGSNIS